MEKGRGDSATRSGSFISLVGDLGFSSKIREIVLANGGIHANARTLERFKELPKEGLRGAILDLTHPHACEVAEWLQGAGTADISVLGFYPHVEKAIPLRFERFAFIQVVTRSKLEGALRALFPEP